MVTFSHHAVNFGAKALLIHHIFGVKTLPIWCQIDTIQSGLVRKQDTFWCENEIFYFSWLGAKTLKLGANSRPMPNCPIEYKLPELLLFVIIIFVIYNLVWLTEKCNLRLIFTGTWNTKFQDCYHFPLLEVDCDLVNKHSSLNSLLTITDQRDFLVVRIIRGLKNVLNKAAGHLVCCEGVEGVIVKSSPSIEDYSWNIEKVRKRRFGAWSLNAVGVSS